MIRDQMMTLSAWPSVRLELATCGDEVSSYVAKDANSAKAPDHVKLIAVCQLSTFRSCSSICVFASSVNVCVVLWTRMLQRELLHVPAI